MRATITVERKQSFPSSLFVASDAVKLLETLPGVSDIRLERAGPTRAVISYVWRPDDRISIGATLEENGLQIAA